MAVKKIPVKFAEAGESGTQILSGKITGEEYNPDLRGLTGLKTLDKMRRNDATVRQALWALKYSIISADWFIEAGGDTAQDVEAQSLVKYNLMDKLNFKHYIEEMLTCLDFGFDVHEMVFDPADYDGQMRILLTKLGYRKQTTIHAWEAQDAAPGVTQQTVTSGLKYIPEAKLVRVTVQQEGDNYEGISMLRSAYKHWYYKEKYYKIEAIGYERQHVGVPFIKYGTGTTDDEKKKMVKLLRNMRANQEAYMMVPLGSELGFMDMGTGSKDIKPGIDHHDLQILKSVFAQFMALGASSSSGSRATSEDHSRFFEMAVTAVADLIAEVVNERIIKTLIDLNYDTKTYPKLCHGKLGDENLPVTSEAVSKFVGAKALTARPEDENIIRKLVGWPELTEDEIAERKEQAEQAREALTQATDPSKTDPQQSKKPVAEDDTNNEVNADAALAEARQLQARLTRALYGNTGAAA